MDRRTDGWVGGWMDEGELLHGASFRKGFFCSSQLSRTGLWLEIPGGAAEGSQSVRLR